MCHNLYQSKEKTRSKIEKESKDGLSRRTQAKIMMVFVKQKRMDGKKAHTNITTILNLLYESERLLLYFICCSLHSNAHIFLHKIHININYTFLIIIIALDVCFVAWPDVFGYFFCFLLHLFAIVPLSKSVVYNDFWEWIAVKMLRKKNVEKIRYAKWLVCCVALWKTSLDLENDEKQTEKCSKFI